MELKQDKLAHINTTFVVTKGKEMPEGQFEAILSTPELDRHGERVSIKGMTIPKDRVVKIYYNHQTYGDKLPIGQWTKIWKSKDGNLMGRGQLDLVDEFEQKIDKKIRLGTLDSISVGFYPQEFDGDTSTWTKSELVEASVVAEPANPQAMISRKELGFTEQEFEEALKEKLEAVEETGENTDEKPSTEDGGATEVDTAIEELKSRVGALETAHEASSENPTTKQLIKIRVIAKEVDKAIEGLNKTLRIKLKGSQNG